MTGSMSALAAPDAQLTPKEAAELLLMRRKARTSYRDYLRYWLRVTRQPFVWNWHWDYLADIMQAVADRDSALRFTIVNIPPRFAKSTLLSQQWQAWMLGREDTRRSSLFSMTTSSTLAARDSRRTLDTVKADWYKQLFPTVEIGDKVTELEWETRGGAYRLACGAGGTVTGRGADHLLWDDLLKADEASSETVREGINEWLGETLRSRLDDQKTGTITGIMQRLHEQDPTGFLLKQMRLHGADQYTHIVLPNEATTKTIVKLGDVVYAEREVGDLLHPERIGKTETLALKASMSNNYEGQYQQNPIKMVGGHLDPRRMLRLQGSALEIKSRLGLVPVFYLDFAGTEKQTQKNDPDYSTILVGARDQLGRCIVLDVWRKQTSDLSVVARTLIQMHKLWRPRWVKGEKGLLLNVFQTNLAQQMVLAGYFLTLIPLDSRRADKVERSLGFQGMLNAGMWAVPESASWLADYEAEMRGFPNATHDDQIDPSSDLANDYLNMPKGDAPVVDPTDPAIILDNEHKRAIAEAVERAKAPLDNDEPDW